MILVVLQNPQIHFNLWSSTEPPTGVCVHGCAMSERLWRATVSRPVVGAPGFHVRTPLAAVSPVPAGGGCWQNEGMWLDGCLCFGKFWLWLLDYGPWFFLKDVKSKIANFFSNIFFFDHIQICLDSVTSYSCKILMDMNS